MTFKTKLIVLNVLLWTNLSVMADTTLGGGSDAPNMGAPSDTSTSLAASGNALVDNSGPQISQNTSNIATYLLNLSGYLGYDATKPNTSLSNTIINAPYTALQQVYSLGTLFGAVPVAAGQSNFQFVPSTIGGAAALNSQANSAFKLANQPSTDSSSTGGGNLTSNKLVDQAPLIADPVSQAIFNILGTPSNTYCLDTTSNPPTKFLSSCPALGKAMSTDTILTNVIAPLTNTANMQPNYTTLDYNQSLLQELNSNSLLAPLYLDPNQQSTPNSNASGSTTSTPSTSSSTLTATNQLQQAENFIRYVTGTMVPPELPTQSDYNTLVTLANTKPTKDPVAQAAALKKLNNFMIKLRTYGAQSSVGLGNLYYILAKRLPQNQVDGLSQALSEYTMATWRINDPTAGNTGAQWTTKINTSSSATVQKEIAVLLSEINYQLYLDRQIQERMLMTQSIMVMQALSNTKPAADDLSSQNDSN